MSQEAGLAKALREEATTAEALFWSSKLKRGRAVVLKSSTLDAIAEAVRQYAPDLANKAPSVIRGFPVVGNVVGALMDWKRRREARRADMVNATALAGIALMRQWADEVETRLTESAASIQEIRDASESIKIGIADIADGDVDEGVKKTAEVVLRARLLAWGK